jgi:RNA polymerase sigma-70 factor (ECF subfamily)
MLGTEAMVGVARDREPDTEVERTFERFFAEEYERLARALFLLTGDGAEAEDLAQEALVRLLERWDRVGKMASPTGYLYRTALNLHRSRRRRVRRSRVPRGEERPNPIETVEDRDELGRALAALPVDQRAALILVEWLGLSSTEAGAILGIEPVSVRVRIARAKRALRDQAESEES